MTNSDICWPLTFATKCLALHKCLDAASICVYSKSMANSVRNGCLVHWKNLWYRSICTKPQTFFRRQKERWTNNWFLSSSSRWLCWALSLRRPVSLIISRGRDACVIRVAQVEAIVTVRWITNRKVFTVARVVITWPATPQYLPKRFRNITWSTF